MIATSSTRPTAVITESSENTITAAVDHLRMTVGDRTIEGQIQERAEAKKRYEQAKEQGKRTSLVEQERPNMFTTSVANIGPGQRITVEIEYQETIRHVPAALSHVGGPALHSRNAGDHRGRGTEGKRNDVGYRPGS
jgi:hypothetical protein